MGPFSFAPPHANDLCLKAGKKKPDLSELEFEARSSKDGAWYVKKTLPLILTNKVGSVWLGASFGCLSLYLL